MSLSVAFKPTSVESRLESIFPHTWEEHEVLDQLMDEEDWEQSASEGDSRKQMQLKEARLQRGPVAIVATDGQCGFRSWPV